MADLTSGTIPVATGAAQIDDSVITQAGGLISVPSGLKLRGSSSGTMSFAVPAAVGTRTITWPAGTTDFSATGGTSQFVKQASAGAAFTVAQPALADLSDAATVALLASPTFTGTPAAPTASTGTSTTQIATTAYVQAQGYTQGHGAQTASSGAATLNQGSGVITTEALTAATTYTLTLTNSKIVATSTVIAIASDATGSVAPPTVRSITPGSGSVVIVCGMVALTGTFDILFAVHN